MERKVKIIDGRIIEEFENIPFSYKKAFQSVCKIKITKQRLNILSLINPSGTLTELIKEKLENSKQSTYKQLSELERAGLIHQKRLEKKVYLTEYGRLCLSVNS
jgi:predicted transcriptional regulator